jgi:hypothetical protein
VIIVDGDPSQEIDALSRVRFVMSNGVVARDDLDSRLPVGGKLLAYTPL